ncbi:MAG: N-acetylmuramoyl-L-alanine amidase [Myxococcota bacterium]|nr:N-acetylmuramoyl-L-alanine amidase [Myxococcota bacterium]
MKPLYDSLTRRVGLAAILLCVPLLLGAERPKGLGDVQDVRTWSYPDYTRVVVELTRSVDLAEDALVRLAANQGAGRPERLYVDVPGIWVGRQYVDGLPVGDGLLEGVRIGQNTRYASRIVIDLQRYGHHRMFTLRSPDRVVIDIYGDRRPDKEPGASHSSSAKRLSMASRPIRKVVIDPGHGGRDPGAIGVGGVREKDINLRLSKLLARRLRARSFEVVLTREDDRYVDLEERTVIAESAGGDLFVSIHANAARNKSLRGIEVYYLDAGHRRHNLDVAARENGVPRGQLDDLQTTLSRLRVAEASHHSKTLADTVHHDLIHGLSQTYSSVPDLGVKQGPFYVLFMSSMPSILVETGFLTHRKESKLLRSERYLDTVAAQIAAGIGHYRTRNRQITAEAAASRKARTEAR